MILFFGFTKDIPFTHGFSVKAQFESANSIRPELAGADRRRRGRQGQVGRAASRAPTPRCWRWSSRTRRCRCTRTRRPRSARASSSRATSSSTSSRARRARRSWTPGDTIKITQTATPVQLDQVLTSLQSDSREDLKALLDGLNDGAELQADGGRGRDAAPLARGPDRGRVLQRRARRHPGRRALDRAGARGAARHRARPRRRAADPRHGAHGRRARPLREPAQGPDHELQPHDGDVRVRVDEPARVDPRAARRRCATPTARSTRSTPRSRRRARSRREIRPGRARDAGDDRRRVPVDRADARAGRPGRARRAGRGALARHRRPRAADRPRDRAAAADRPRRPSACATSSCPAGDLVDPGRVHDRRGELQGVLLRAGGHRRRGPELRRQRHVRALPDRRRLADGLARARARRAPGELFGNNVEVPLGNRPGLPGQAAAVQARRALLQAEAAGRQRPGGGEVAADRRGRATAAQVKSERDKLRREADLAAVRAKLNPFGAKRRPRRRRPSEDGDPQAPAGLPGHPRPADRGRRGVDA